MKKVYISCILWLFLGCLYEGKNSSKKSDLIKNSISNRYKDFDFDKMEGKNLLKIEEEPYPCLEVVKIKDTVKILLYFDPAKFGDSEEEPIEKIFIKQDDYYMNHYTHREPKGSASQNLEYFYYSYIFKDYILKTYALVDHGLNKSSKNLEFKTIKKLLKNKIYYFDFKEQDKPKNNFTPEDFINNSNNYKMRYYQEFFVKEDALEIKEIDLENKEELIIKRFFKPRNMYETSTARKDGFSYFFDIYLR